MRKLPYLETLSKREQLKRKRQDRAALWVSAIALFTIILIGYLTQ